LARNKKNRNNFLKVPKALKIKEKQISPSQKTFFGHGLQGEKRKAPGKIRRFLLK